MPDFIFNLQKFSSNKFSFFSVLFMSMNSYCHCIFLVPSEQKVPEKLVENKLLFIVYCAKFELCHIIFVRAAMNNFLWKCVCFHWWFGWFQYFTSLFQRRNKNTHKSNAVDGNAMSIQPESNWFQWWSALHIEEEKEEWGNQIEREWARKE